MYALSGGLQRAREYYKNKRCRMARIIFAVACFTVCGVHGTRVIVDLSHLQKPGLVVYPGFPDLTFTIGHRGISATQPELWVEVNTFTTVEHYGTHVDAPSHMKEGKWRLHQVPLSQFMGTAVVVDITKKALQDQNAQLTVADLEAWEDKYGRIPDGAIVLMRTDWHQKFADGKAYLGTDQVKNASTLNFPGFHADAAQWLVDNRPNLNGIGVDTMSLDYGPSSTYPTHQIIFAANKIGFENLANLDKIPPSGAMFHAPPMNLYDGSGCPVRAFAVIDSNASAATGMDYMLYLVIALAAISVFFNMPVNIEM